MLGLLWLALGCGGRPPAAEEVARFENVTAEHVAGTWTGTLDAGVQKLRLVVRLEAVDGGYTATMDSPDQGANGIPVTEVEVTDRGVRFRVPSVSGRYEGTWTEAGELTGTWSQSIASLSLDLKKGEAEAPKRPQEPKPPFVYATEDVTFDGGAGVTLAGTLTLPVGEGPHPAVVLVSGSGPQDRDSTLMGHKPFLLLADRLTQAGMAVLRYDDRGFGSSTGNFAAATTQDFARDAVAAHGFLAARDDIRADRVGIVGHSEGALVATLATPQADVAFVGLLAGPALRGRELLVSQVGALAKAAGSSDAEVQTTQQMQGRILDLVMASSDEASLRAAVKEAGLSNPAVDAQLGAMSSPWYRAFLALDPAPALATLDMPVLALFGSLDVQVTAADNAPVMRKALEGQPDASVEVLEGLNHLFQPATTGMPTEYATIETTMAPAALDRIVAFAKAQQERP